MTERRFNVFDVPPALPDLTALREAWHESTCGCNHDPLEAAHAYIEGLEQHLERWQTTSERRPSHLDHKDRLRHVPVDGRFRLSADEHTRALGVLTRLRSEPGTNAAPVRFPDGGTHTVSLDALVEMVAEATEEAPHG